MKFKALKEKKKLSYSLINVAPFKPEHPIYQAFKVFVDYLNKKDKEEIFINS